MFIITSIVFTILSIEKHCSSQLVGSNEEFSLAIPLSFSGFYAKNHLPTFIFSGFLAQLGLFSVLFGSKELETT